MLTARAHGRAPCRRMAARAPMLRLVLRPSCRARGPSNRGIDHAQSPSRPNRPLRVGAVPGHHDLRRWCRYLGPDRRVAAGRRRTPGRSSARRRHQFHRHRRCLCRRLVGADHRTGAEEPEGAARERHRRHQGFRRDRARTECARRLAQSHPRRRQGQPQAAAARPYRSLPDPRLRPGHPDRGDRARARSTGAAGPRALRRRLELGRLADRQGTRHRRAPGAFPL